MITSNISRLNLLVRGCDCCCLSLKSPSLKNSRGLSLVKRYISRTIDTRYTRNGIRRWRMAVPLGIGVSLLATTQWKYLQKHGYSTDTDDKPELLNDVMVTCYCCLPLRITSRVWGWLTSINLPISLRPMLYRSYANMFHANLDEIELDLSAFPSLVEFFVRALKNNARPIAQDVNMTSPADGKVLYFGPVSSCRVEQVKGVTYNLKYFLGDLNNSLSDQITEVVEQTDDYVKSLLKNPDNKLYQLIIYLAPGDYHRFHSPTDWDIKFRRHFPGKLLSVNPRVLKYMPDLFSLNERVLYVGEWPGGFMAYAVIGATNVGSIKVYCDKKLATNTIQWPETIPWQDVSLDCTRINKGQLFGEFRLGSTIVLLFEAPQDFQFCLQAGQSIKVGQPLSVCNKANERQVSQIPQHLIINVAHNWKDIYSNLKGEIK